MRIVIKQLPHLKSNSFRKQVDDKGYHAILETVFRIAKVDIIGLARATKHTSSKIASRLSACASLIRTVVEVGLVKLRYKTVKALVEHISQTLPTADADYCEPLLVDYFKALSTLLGYRAHVEHLSPDDWHEISQFCVETAQDLNRLTSLRNGDVSSNHGSHSSGSQKSAYPQLQVSNEDILLCLRHLLSAANAPIIEKAESVLNLVLDLLSSYAHRNKIQHNLYEIIDSILARILTSNTSLSLRTMGSVIPLIGKTWERATQSQREPMLSILVRGELLLGHLTHSENGTEFLDDLGNLLAVMREQYCKVKPKDQLSMEHLEFSGLASSGSQANLTLHAASLRICTHKGEEPWHVIHVSAAIYVALDTTATLRLEPDENDGFPNPSKRRKISRPMDNLLQDVKNTEPPIRVYALQVLAFSFSQKRLKKVDAQEITDLLMSIISGDDSSVVPWAILAVAT